MPQVGLDHQSFCRKPRPTESSRRFSPVVRSPPGWSVCRLESSQRQTTPEAMKETAIGKRYTARKKPSPLAGLSRSQAQRKPKIRVPARNTTVRISRFHSECWKFGSANRLV